MPPTVEPLICQWVLHEWLLVAETLKTKRGLFSAALELFATGKGAEKQLKESLCSPLEERLDSVDPLYKQNQEAEAHEAAGGRRPNLNVFICSVDVV